MRAVSWYLFALLLGLVMSGTAAAQCVTPPGGLVSWWPGDGTAEDILGDNEGTMSGGATFSPGQVAEAFSFDGIDDYVDAGNDPTVRPDFPFSVDFWIRRDSETDFFAISSTDTSGNGIYSGFRVLVSEDGAVITGIGNDLGNCSPLFRKNHLTVAGVVPLGTWHHVAVVFEDALLHRIYVDGAALPTVPSGAATSMNYGPGNRLQLGRAYNPNIGSFVFAEGSLDEADLHLGIVRPGEIAAIFAAGGGGKCKPEGPVDFGDAPSPYPTSMREDGACHLIQPGVHLGQAIDADADGLPDEAAAGDDVDGLDDEDGVQFLTTLEPHLQASIEVVASTPGLLSAWIDWDAHGSWAEPHDAVLIGTPLSEGSNTLFFEVPTLGLPERTTFARFRFCTSPGLSPTGLAPDGEVEDYQIVIEGDPSAVDAFPARTILGQNHPNPFQAQTTIRFALAHEASVQLTVYTSAGRRVRRLLEERLGPGQHTVSWDGADHRGRHVASGSYFYQLRVDGRTAQVRKALLDR